MARFEFKLPDIGEGIAEAEITAWHVSVGERVEEDQPLADMMTDKATVEMEAPVSGTVVELAGDVGDMVPIGAVLAVIDTEDEEVPLGDGAVEPTAAIEKALPTAAIQENSAVSTPARPERNGCPGETREDEPRPNGFPGESREDEPRPTGVGKDKPRVLASPAVRQRARDLGIDLAQVKSAGERIRHSDLDQYLLYHGGGGHRPPPRADEKVKLVGLRRRTAEKMALARQRIPHFTLVEEFDVTALEETRAMINRDRGERPSLTLLPFLITAMARALADWPMLNATFDDQAMTVTRHGAVHVGIATQTRDGLMVPVVRDAQRLSLWQLSGEIRRLAEAARSGKAAREELGGSTITISSLGPLGGVSSTPVINHPEVAIIAVNKIEDRPVIVGGRIEPRKRMNLSLSCDHRVVDGWDAAQFLAGMKLLIENPLRLLS